MLKGSEEGRFLGWKWGCRGGSEQATTSKKVAQEFFNESFLKYSSKSVIIDANWSSFKITCWFALAFILSYKWLFILYYNFIDETECQITQKQNIICKVKSIVIVLFKQGGLWELSELSFQSQKVPIGSQDLPGMTQHHRDSFLALCAQTLFKFEGES